jgi:hypothetical protein
MADTIWAGEFINSQKNFDLKVWYENSFYSILLRENIRKITEMVRVFMFGLIVIDLKGNREIIKEIVKVFSWIKVAVFNFFGLS